jgi:hypothetical protein
VVVCFRCWPGGCLRVGLADLLLERVLAAAGLRANQPQPQDSLIKSVAYPSRVLARYVVVFEFRPNLCLDLPT